MTAEVNNEVPVWLRPLLARTQPASAYLITGDEGAGADVLAFALAAKFSGVADITQHPDIMLVRPTEPESAKKSDGTKKGNIQIRVAQAREIIGFCALMPMTIARRIVVVFNAAKMNSQAQNALLKNLEEPRPTKMFILRARYANQLKPTIVSRCQIIATPLPSQQQATQWIKENGGDESDLYFASGLPMAAGNDGETRELRAAIVGEMNKGAKADIHAAAGLCAKSGEWLDCLQKWAADGARVAAGASPRYFPAAGHLRAPLARWLDLHAKLIRRKMLLDHPLAADLRIRETLHACRQTLAD